MGSSVRRKWQQPSVPSLKIRGVSREEGGVPLGLEFRVWGLGFRVWGLGWGLGFRVPKIGGTLYWGSYDQDPTI